MQTAENQSAPLHCPTEQWLPMAAQNSPLSRHSG